MIVKYEGDKNHPYATHQVPLELTVRKTEQGDILECGIGDTSTNLLRKLCVELNRTLCSLEDSAQYIDQFSHMRNSYHIIERIINWSDNHWWFTREWAVVFVDNNPASARKQIVEKMADLAQYIVVHDTENPAYGFEETFDKFKYRFDYLRESPNTTIVSNFNRCNL